MIPFADANHYDSQILIIGGGFGGLHAAKALVRNKNLRITLLDRSNHHLFQPLLYQVATAALSPSQIAYPLREIFKNDPNMKVLFGEVKDLDLSAHKVQLENGQWLEFDLLILAVGARHFYFGHPEWEALAPGLKTIPDALEIRERLLLSFEKAEKLALLSMPRDIQKASPPLEPYLRFIIIGGGPTGVEMAGSISELVHQSLEHNFRGLNLDQVEILLIEGSPRILPFMPTETSERAKQDLEKMRVKVLVNKKVTRVTEDGVEVDGDFLRSYNVIWAAGNQASPLLKKLGTSLDPQGRAIVNPDLSVPGHPDVFVVGDAAHFKDARGRPLPAVAPVAIQQGRYLGKWLGKKQRMNQGQNHQPPFRFRDKGNLATIGRAKAVGVIGPFKPKGFLAWFLWGIIHITYLIGFRNRYIVLAEWFFHYLFKVRGARLIHSNPSSPFKEK